MQTYRAAVIGSPIAQSKSPVLHRVAYDFLQQVGWEYTKDEVTLEGLPSFITQVKSNAKGQAKENATWRGFSVTMPLKQAVMQYLDSVDEVALETSAVNTVVVSCSADTPAGAQSTKDGDFDASTSEHVTLTGYNTDVYGIVQAVQTSEHFAPTACSATPGSTLILGNGATSRSAKAAMHEMGFEDVAIAGRSGEFDVDINDTDSLNLAANEATCIVSTLPWGAADSILPKLDGEAISAKPFLECAFPKVLPSSIDGEVMLAYQAIRQVELMTRAQMSTSQQSELLQRMLTALSEV
ncbi:MAG: hypothetical protein LBC50_00510 [Candidatus Ancillula sp.]|jgi:shikimate dehydrogenase|nr:hypothetical protein [Candidatus Ancillula sp.]